MPILMRRPAKPAAVAPSTIAIDVPTAAPETGPLADIRKLIDEIGKGEAKYAKAAAELIEPAKVMKAHHEKQKRLAELINALDDDREASEKVFAIEGEKYKASMSARAKTRELIPEGVHRVREMVGDELFFQMIDLPLGKLDDYLSANQRKEVLDEGFGKRKSLAIEKIGK